MTYGTKTNLRAAINRASDNRASSKKPVGFTRSGELYLLFLFTAILGMFAAEVFIKLGAK